MRDKGNALAGSDLYCFNINFKDMKYLDEHLIDQFLETQKQHDGAVKSWTYNSPSLRHLIRKINPKIYDDTYFSDTTGYKMYQTNIYSI